MWPPWRPDSPDIRLGTASWSSKEWEGGFYPPGTPPQRYIGEYSRRLPTVEIDSSFYGIPRRSSLESWRDQTPEGFLFAAKVPQVITHEKYLVDCEEDTEAFLRAISILGDRLGPILFQFQYYSRKKGMSSDDFYERLKPYVENLPREGFCYAVEVRNKTWIDNRLLDLLCEHRITLALIDHPYMYSPEELLAFENILTGNFAYVRWLGDRYAIEKITEVFNESVIDRRADLERWVPLIKHILDAQKPLFGYFNNHYSGYAIADAELFIDVLQDAQRRETAENENAPTHRT
jgi:uncharacterized protein YecE (DUF72 family)